MVFVEVNESEFVLCMTGRHMGDGNITLIIVGSVWTFWIKEKFLFFLDGKQIVLVAVRHSNIIFSFFILMATRFGLVWPPSVYLTETSDICSAVLCFLPISGS
jgi:hypothetical protein